MSQNYTVTAGVGSTAVQVVPGNAGRNFLIIQNVGSVTAFFAFDANVTSTVYAFSLSPQAIVNLSGPLTYGGPIYAITASSTTSISYGDVSQ